MRREWLVILRKLNMEEKMTLPVTIKELEKLINEGLEESKDVSDLVKLLEDIKRDTSLLGEFLRKRNK